MASTLSSDPYKILGVEPDADAATIKKAYRKLVLNCHPDKVTDESLKAQKQEEFHQIQQAYETVGDADNRTKYELELKAKRLREERDRVMSKNSPASARHVNVNVYGAHPADYRSGSSKHSPSKPPPKPYSSDYSRSWEHDIPTRSRTYYEEPRKTRRTMSDEKLKRERDDSRERERRRRERAEDREQERRAQDELERRRRREKEQREREKERERELLKEKERERVRKEAIRRQQREQEEKEQREMRARQERKAAKEAKERAERERQREAKRRQEDEKLRAKPRAYVEPYSEEDEERRSRPRKPSRKESSSREKSSSKPRDRASPRDEAIPEMPTADKITSSLAFAAQYIKKQSPVTQTADPPFSSAEYKDPNAWAPPKRRVVSGEGKHAMAEAAIPEDSDSPPSPAAQAPPRLQKSYTMGTMPAAEAPPLRVPLGRSQTMEPDFFSRVAGADKHRSSRGRSSMDEDDAYFAPRVQKYKINTDKGTPRVFETAEYSDPYGRGPSIPFGKVKTSPTYGVENLSTARNYGREEYQTSKYATPSYSDYQTAFVAART